VKCFFSEENMDRIQRQIKREVFRLSRGKYRLVVDQDEFTLLEKMKFVYGDYGKYLPNNIVRQVKKLNEFTLDYIMPSIMTAIKQDQAYLKENVLE